METSAKTGKKKRQITEARRRQGREAQKKYREKQKRLDDLSKTASLNTEDDLAQATRNDGPSSSSTSIPAASLQEQVETWPIAPMPTSISVPVQLSVDEHRLVAHSSAQDANIPVALPAVDLLEDQYENLGTSPGALNIWAASPPIRNSTSLDEPADNGSQIGQVTVSHLGNLPPAWPTELPQSDDVSAEPDNSTWPSQPLRPQSLWFQTLWSNGINLAPSIPLDSYVRIHQYSLYQAWVQNARMIGHSLDDHPPSPPGEECHRSLWTGGLILAEERIRSALQFAPDLAPTRNQLQHPHDLYIDCLPFPELRDKIISLVTAKTKMVDTLELKLDIHNAVQCWGPTPWERKSWEFQAWFLRKWWVITGGDHGELARLSRWWRLLRGQTS